MLLRLKIENKVFYCLIFFTTYQRTKAESDSVAIIFVEQKLLAKKEGAAHRNIFCVTVRCTFMV